MKHLCTCGFNMVSLHRYTATPLQCGLCPLDVGCVTIYLPTNLVFMRLVYTYERETNPKIDVAMPMASSEIMF